MICEQHGDRLFHGDDDFWRDHAPCAEPHSSLDTPLREQHPLRRSLHDRPSTQKASHNIAQGQRRSRATLGIGSPMLANPAGVPQTMLLEIETSVVPQTSDRQNAFSWWRKLNLAGLFCGLLLAAMLLVKGHHVEQTSTRPIEDFLPGQKAIVDAPKEALATDIARLNDREAKWNANDGSLEVEGIEDPLRALTSATPEQITRADYRLIKLRADDVWSDGTLDQINVQTLQPWQWIQEHEVRVGGEAPLPLDVEEMGLDEGLRGTVLDILPCPEFEKGRGRIVLTTVNHLNRDVRELTLRAPDGTIETLRPTGNHKFYSVSRGEWLPASDLQNGERLDGVQVEVTVVASRIVPGTHRVYNFTVQGEHLYRVGSSGVLVHNTCGDEIGKRLVESLAAIRFKARYGRGLTANTAQNAPDFADVFGKTYDHMGFPGMARNWAKQKTQFFKQLDDHLLKADNVVIDLTDFPQHIKNEVAAYILTMSDAQVDRIFPIGF